LADDVQPVRVKIDPASKTAGVAIITEEDGNKPAKVGCLFELAHPGRQISEAVTARRAFRRRRRGANLRCGHRGSITAPVAKGWLARRACSMAAFAAFPSRSSM
jgi:hypothetical protein